MIYVFIALIIYFLICYIMFVLICKVSRFDLFKMIDKKIEESLIPYKDIIDSGVDFVNSKKGQILSIKSFDNLTLKGLYIKNNIEKGILVLAHGYRSTMQRDLFSSVQEYYKMGFSILLISQRACDISEGKYITFGYKESKDIDKWINYIHKKNPKKKIVLGGISLGASSVLMVNNKHISAIIADSGYSDAYKELRYVIHHYFHMPAILFLPVINLFCIILAGFNLKKTNTYNNLDKINIPILFIHGFDDDFVPHENSIDNYNYYKHSKDILIIKGATHGMGYLVDKEKYIDKIKTFLKRYVI